MKNVQNKKVKNATKIEVDGILFRSKLEAYTYKKLKEANIDAEYEMYRYTLLPAFTFNEKKFRPMTYLPDFVGNGFIIECKGFRTDTWPLREKLFNYYLANNSPDTKFYIVNSQKEVDKLIDSLCQNS